MQTDDVVVRVQVQDGTWETIGSDRYSGIVPENFQGSANAYGHDKASFDLHRIPGAQYPDLSAESPTEIEVAGRVVFVGRIAETPDHDGDDPVVTVQVKGRQYDLDDDSYPRNFVHTLISAWRDARTFITEVLTSYTTAGSLQNENGATLLGWPNGAVLPADARVGITLDLGPDNTATSISIDIQGITGAANGTATVYARAHSQESEHTSGTGSNTQADAFNMALSAIVTGSFTLSGTFATPARYVTIFLYQAAGVTLNGDVSLQITGIRVFSNEAWRSVDHSVLKAPAVIKDALTQRCPLLARDFSQIDPAGAIGFNIPDLHFEIDPKTPREIIDGVNALHNWITKIDEQTRMVFKARPSAPVFEVGAWGGSTFEDTAAGSAQDVYNRALIVGTGSDGSPVLVSRYSAQRPGAVPLRSEVAATFVAGGSLTPTDNFASLLYPIRAGMPVLIVAKPQPAGAGFPNFSVTGKVVTLTVGNQGNPAASGYGDYGVFQFGSTQPGPLYFLWIPTKDHTDTLEVRVDLSNNTNGGSILVDVYRGGTVQDRRGKQHTMRLQPPGTAVTTTVANQLGDTFLDAHRTQPLIGRLTVTSTGVRKVLTGETFHPAWLLNETQQLVRLGSRTDPDTGGVGRDGTIAAVAYNQQKRESAVDIDDTRHDYEALVTRYAALTPA